ncbi:MAG TPA: DnaJ domain-containing protein [Polyangiaceae bacterium]|nr:DnaJ domain-containing protein [Polyangiaceae bacterium]HPY17198.1 DnaJ domain-containing protein [Polyangiaceae bacterium]HQM08191.1 DnaJ domain-containing protein [Polyangiaceae bacterium]
MILPGRLQSTTLGDVLGRLHRAQATGELELIGHDAPYRGCCHRIVMRDGMVCDVGTPIPVPRLGEVLLEQGDLSIEQHHRFVDELQRLPKVKAGEILVREGFVTQQQVENGLGRQTRLRLDAVFSLQQADIRFHPLGRFHSKRKLEPFEFLHGRRRARGADSPALPLRQAYETLGLSPNASRAQVRRTFRKLATTCHPDLFTNLPESQRRQVEARFSALSSAYHRIVTQD